MPNAVDESEKLLSELLPFAREMLQRRGTFDPFGGYVDIDGEIQINAVLSKPPVPDYAQEMVSLLVETSQLQARKRSCRATIIILDVKAQLPGAEEKTGDIQVFLDHLDYYSVEIFYPYVVSGPNVTIGTSFAQKGKDRIFPREPEIISFWANLFGRKV